MVPRSSSSSSTNRNGTAPAESRGSFYLLSFPQSYLNGSWNEPFKMCSVVIETFWFHPERKNNLQYIKFRFKSIHLPYDFFIESSVRSMYHPFNSTVDSISFKTKISFCFFMPAKKGVFQSETPPFYFGSSTGCICLPCTALSTAAGSRLKSDTTEFGLFSGSSCAMGTK